MFQILLSHGGGCGGGGCHGSWPGGSYGRNSAESNDPMGPKDKRQFMIMMTFLGIAMLALLAYVVILTIRNP